MRCTIEPHVTDGLKVIREIPDIPLCMLEGRNGIGKTVAIHLLELISGSIPEEFQLRPILWSSLRERLGPTSVHLDNLNGNRSLAVRFTPDLWEESLPTSLGEWLGTATIDGEPQPISACSALLSVTRIAGNEDLEVTLRKRVATLSGYLDFASKRVLERERMISARLEGIVPEVREADPAAIKVIAAQLDAVESELREAKARSTAADARLSNLLRALETRRQLDAAGVAADTLLARREELTNTVKALTSDLHDKEREADDASAAFSAEGEAQKKLADAERILRYRQGRLANLQREIKEHAASLSLQTSISSSAIARAISVGESRLADLQRTYRSLDSTSLVRDLIGGIVVPLRAAETDAGDQILVRTEEGGLTVSQTLGGVTRRQQELADQPQPAQIREIESQIDTARRQVGSLRHLASTFEQLERQQLLVTQAQDEADTAVEQAEQASAAARRLREATRAVGAAQAALTKAHEELASVQQQIGATGATSREDAAADLEKALTALGLSADEAAVAEDAARQALAEADVALAELNEAASAIRRRLAVRQADLDLVINRLRENRNYRWLWESIDGLESKLIDPEERYRAFARLRTAILQAADSGGDAVDFIASLLGIANSFFEKDLGKRDGVLVQTLRPAFEAVLGQRLRDALNSPSIRDAIFDGAEVVRVEADTRQLTLRDSNGSETKRPMEAFSSGEQAFAFTQARLAGLESPQKPNRLLVLDEFGAYVAADRLPDLSRFLASDIGRVADQIIVILPLHVDYDSEISETQGKLRARYQERLDQIKERAYCAVNLV